MENAPPSPLVPHRFEHEAMATTFAIHIHHPDARYAGQAAAEAFRHCDKLEEELSRFIEYSSISRLNRTPAGAEIPIGADAYLCLRQALHIAALTGGAFDPGFRSRGQQEPGPYLPAVALSDKSVSAAPTRDKPDLDLGAVGKGYAIDKMAEILAEWNIERALIMGGWSTLLAIGTPPELPGWQINLAGTSSEPHYLPPGSSVSASGFEVRGDHVRDPVTGARTGQANRTWAIAPSAAVSDALSTAALVLPGEKLAELADKFPDCGFVLQRESKSLQTMGREIPF